MVVCGRRKKPNGDVDPGPTSLLRVMIVALMIRVAYRISRRSGLRNPTTNDVLVSRLPRQGTTT
jgi:hypothetical protein